MVPRGTPKVADNCHSRPALATRLVLKRGRVLVGSSGFRGATEETPLLIVSYSTKTT